MAINKEKHKQDIQRFAKEEKVYKTFADTLNVILNKAAKLYAPLAIVQTRPKNISSFAEKIIRKNKYKDPLKDITDLCGARIITQTQEQISRICEFIKESFLIDEANSLDVSKRLLTGEFGYRSVHFIVTPVKDEILGVKIPDELKDKKAEVQVRTLLQHTWADVLHDRLYKTALKIPKEWERESARLAALLENADENISRITSLTDSFTANYGNQMNKEVLYNEIDTLKTILDNVPDEYSKPVIALKIARLAKFPGDWDLSLEMISGYVATPGKVQDEIKLEMGLALCIKHKANINSSQFKQGIRYLAEIEKAVRDSDEAMKLRALALKYLAEVNTGIEPFEKIRSWYNDAFQLEPENPYLFAKVLEYNAHFCDHKLLIRQNILKAIQHCENDIRLGIESLTAYFTIGRLSLIIEENQKAFNAYLKAVDLCLSEKVCVSEDYMRIEIESLVLLKGSIKADKVVEQLKTILTIANYLKFGDGESLAQLISEAIKKNINKSPIVLLAGGADNIIKSNAGRYGSFLIEAVKNFHGTLISGGTKSGVPGLLGSAVDLARKMGNNNIQLIGYVPKKFSSDTKVDNAYQLVKTNGIGFTELETIQMWVDLIATGAKPNEVRMFGLDGGLISQLEYHLALALGAHLGVINESGNAVTELLRDAYWCNHQNLHIIPNESESVWAFINHQIKSALTQEQLKEMAKAIHENYVKEQLALLRKEPNLKKWEDLNDDFKKSNISQAVFIIELLNCVGLGIRKAVKDGKERREFTKDELIKMARLEHGRFVAERLMSGWKYGSKKDVDKKISPYLISWDELTEEVKQYDFDAILNFPSLLETAGFEIYKI